MTEATKAEVCMGCGSDVALEWFPPVECGGRSLPGTGQWRSLMIDGLCPCCCAAKNAIREEERAGKQLKRRLIQLLGGEKPFREFTFERYRVTFGNRLAFLRAKNFSPTNDNLYLWGPNRVGKTHLAYAIAHRALEEGHAVEILRPWQLIRKVRMKTPEEEQAVIDHLVRATVFVLDDHGVGTETAYARQILQEILDARDFRDQGGLVVTSRYSLSALARRIDDDTIPSRLASLCQCVEITSLDDRVQSHVSRPVTPLPGPPPPPTRTAV